MSFTAGKIAFWLYLFVLVVALGLAFNPADPDLWHRLAAGEMICRTGHFPTGDTFSYLADYHLIADHEWGSGVIFFLVDRLAGGAGIIALKLLLMGGTLALVARAALLDRRPGALLAAFGAIVLLALLPSFQSTLRSMAFTNFFFALWVYWSRRDSLGRPVSPWLYLVTMIVWANLHGGFVLGLVWLFALFLVDFFTGRSWRMSLLRLLLCGAATLVNPFGWGLWQSTFRALFTPRAGFDEWAPVTWWPDLLAYSGYKLLVFMTAIGFGYLWWKRRGTLFSSTTILIAGAFLLSLVSGRHIPLFVIVTGAWLPSLLPAEPRLGEILDPPLRLAYAALLAFVTIFPLFSALLALPGDGFSLRLPANSCPVAAVRFLRQESFRGNLLVPFNYGSYALWHLRGHMRVSMDGRYDLVYTPATYRRVDDFFAARASWPTLLTTPRPDAILLPIADPVYAKLDARPDWRQVYRDANDAVFLPSASRP